MITIRFAIVLMSFCCFEQNLYAQIIQQSVISLNCENDSDTGLYVTTPNKAGSPASFFSYGIFADNASPTGTAIHGASSGTSSTGVNAISTGSSGTGLKATSTNGNAIIANGETALWAIGNTWGGYFQGDVCITAGHTIYGTHAISHPSMVPIADTKSKNQVLNSLSNLPTESYRNTNDNLVKLDFSLKSLQEVYPALIKTYKDKSMISGINDEKNIEQRDKTKYGIDYIGFIPILTQSINEQQVIIEKQKQTILKQEQAIIELKQQQTKLSSQIQALATNIELSTSNN